MSFEFVLYWQKERNTDQVGGLWGRLKTFFDQMLSVGGIVGQKNSRAMGWPCFGRKKMRPVGKLELED